MLRLLAGRALTWTPRGVVTLWWRSLTILNGCISRLSLRDDWLRDESIVVAVRCKRLVDRGASSIATALVLLSLSLWQCVASVSLTMTRRSPRRRWCRLSVWQCGACGLFLTYLQRHNKARGLEKAISTYGKEHLYNETFKLTKSKDLIPLYQT